MEIKISDAKLWVEVKYEEMESNSRQEVKERLKEYEESHKNTVSAIQSFLYDCFVGESEFQEEFFNVAGHNEIKYLIWKIRDLECELNNLKKRNGNKLLSALKEIESLTRNPKEYEPSTYSINHIAREAINHY